jgi:type IV secretion system protein VirB9
VRLSLAILLCLVPGCAAAQVRSQPAGTNPHAHTVEYTADTLTLLEVAPGYQLTIEFASDEHIENVALGDSSAWQLNANHRGDRLFVKLLQPGVATNMVVVTDARTYMFDLVPLDAATPSMAYTVRFRYADATPAPSLAAASPSVGHYRSTGTKALRPAGIHDDGTHTFIEWPADQPLPATYAIDSHGRETLVNGMMREGLMVIDSVHPKLVFRLDGRHATAIRLREEGKER